jgi:hypothetical protein
VKLNYSLSGCMASMSRTHKPKVRPMGTKLNQWRTSYNQQMQMQLDKLYAIPDSCL